MIREKAIEILSASAFRGVTTHDQDFKDALKFAVKDMHLLQGLARNSHLFQSIVDNLKGD